MTTRGRQFLISPALYVESEMTEFEIKPVDICEHRALQARVELLEVRVWALAGMSFILGAGIILSLFL